MTVFSYKSCHCTLLRGAARSATRMYDNYIRESGLSIAQVALISAAMENPDTPSGELGRILGLDKSTLGRNLRPLARGNIISLERGRLDKRTRTVRVTQAGVTAFEKASQLWARAEIEYVRLVGKERAAMAAGACFHISEDLSDHTQLPVRDVSNV